MSGPECTYRWFHAATAGLPGDHKLEVFNRLPASWQRDCEKVQQHQIDARREIDNLVESKPQVVTPQPVRPARGHRVAMADDDIFRTLTAREYFEALTGEAVPPSGMVRCPCRNHEDRHPSCKVGGTGEGEGLWHCFSCGAGGSVYDLSAELSGIEPRGHGFYDLQMWIAQRLLGAGL